MCSYGGMRLLHTLRLGLGETGVPARGRLNARSVVAACLPVVCWLGVIALASTDLASQARGDTWLWRFLGIFSGGADDAAPADLSTLSWAVRKAAHLGVYAILGILSARALTRLHPRFRETGGTARFWPMAVWVLPFGAVVAALDELHQSLLASRTGSLSDAALDVVGLGIGLALWTLAGRRRDRQAAASGPESDRRA